jgi:hypothetical protein
MKDKKSPTHLIFVAVHLTAALLTLLPMASASKPCLLGYKALCSFSPISTAGMLVLVGLHLVLHFRQPTTKSQSS